MSDNPLSPIERSSPEDRIISFEKQSNSIYNKFSPYEGNNDGIRIGSQQPYVWTKISDSTTARNLTKYDTQTFPIGSTVRDVQRMGKFMASGTGLLFIGKQYLLQRQTAFSENRIYNPLSVLSATSVRGTTGLIERPTRHLAGGGNGFGSFAASSLLSLAGISVETDVVGVADGQLSRYARIGNKANGKGLVHFESAKSGLNRFGLIWGQSVENKNESTPGGFLQELGMSLLKKFVPSTQPFGFGSTRTSNWTYRPEYPENGDNGLAKGAYHVMLDDTAGMLAVHKDDLQITTPDGMGFFNTIRLGIQNTAFSRLFGVSSINTENKKKNFTGAVNQIHRYFPGKIKTETENWYAKKTTTNEDEVGSDKTSPVRPQKNIKEYQIEELKKASISFITNKITPRSIERYKNINGQNDQSKDYNSIPGGNDKPKFEKKIKDHLTLDARKFSKGRKKGEKFGEVDEYNTKVPFNAPRSTGDRAPNDLILGSEDSKDIIFFYFYDLVNSIYIPFRATINGINDLHSPDWDEVSYIGRADKLYIYKGFTREVNFTFTVYANSLKELVPMWKRINYLVGLSRPSKYTEVQVNDGGSNSDGQTDTAQFLFDSGRSSQFMFPPMVTFRLGDMYVDQPCVLKSIGVIIPDDAQWETQRGSGQAYSYLNGVGGLNFSGYSSDTMYQLPTKVDITINMSIMEKQRSITKADHFGIGINSNEL